MRIGVDNLDERIWIFDKDGRQIISINFVELMAALKYCDLIRMT